MIAARIICLMFVGLMLQAQPQGNNATVSCLSGDNVIINLRDQAGNVYNSLCLNQRTRHYYWTFCPDATPFQSGTGACPAGSSTGAGGSNTQIQYNCSGLLCGFTLNGDCTVVASTGVITCIIKPQLQFRTCVIAVGADNATSFLTNADLGPQAPECDIGSPAGTTFVLKEIRAWGVASTDTFSIIVGRDRQGATADLLSTALTTGVGGTLSCSNATGVTSLIDGVTSCVGTLQNTALRAGDRIYWVSGTTGATGLHFVTSITWGTN